MDNGFLCASLVGAALFSMLGAALGGRNGRGGAGLLLGLFLGPIGCLVAAVLPATVEHTERRMRARLQMEANLRAEMGLPGGAITPPNVAPAQPAGEPPAPTAPKAPDRTLTALLLVALAAVAAAYFRTMM